MHADISVDLHVVFYFYHTFLYSRLQSHALKLLFQDDFSIENTFQKAGVFFPFFYREKSGHGYFCAPVSPACFPVRKNRVNYDTDNVQPCNSFEHRAFFNLRNS